MKQDKLYKTIASTIGALDRCDSGNMANAHWSGVWREYLENQLQDVLPSGSGFDAGSFIDIEASTDERIVIRTSYHHMNENGMYDGWTEHGVIVMPSLQFGFTLRITGPNRNDIKNYISEVFSEVLDSPAPVRVDGAA